MLNQISFFYTILRRSLKNLIKEKKNPPAVRAWQEADGGDVLAVYSNLRASAYYTFTFLDYILGNKSPSCQRIMYNYLHG